MANKGVKMNLGEFNGGASGDLPAGPGGASSGVYRPGSFGGARRDDDGGDRPRYGGYGGARGGDRDGDREDRPRRRLGEDGEEEPAPPSRADEASAWRNSGARPASERPSGGYGGSSRYGDRDGGRDGGYGGSRYGDREGGDRREGGYGARSFGGRDSGSGSGYGGSSGGDSRPAHLRFGRSAAGGDSGAAASAAPVSDRFKKPEEPRNEAGADERDGGREERRPYGGDRDGGDRPRYGGARDGDRDRESGDRPRYGGYGGARDGGDRDGGRFGGDRDGGDRPPRYGGYGGARDGDRDGGRDGGRFGDRPSGGFGGGSRYGDRDGGRDGGRYGGYGAARNSSYDMNAPLPTGPSSRQDDYEPRPARLALQKKTNLDARPAAAKEERKVEIDQALTSKGVVAISEKKTPLEVAAEDNTTITDTQLEESMKRLKLDKVDTDAYGVVLAKSLIDGTVSLGNLVVAASNKEAPTLLIAALAQLRNKKSDKALLDLIATAQAQHPKLDVLKTLAGERKGAELDAFLDANNLLALKPIPDLSADITEQLTSGKKPEEVLASINSAVDAKSSPGAKAASAVAQFLFTEAFKDGKTVNFDLVKSYAPLLQRVAPGSDADAQLRVLFEAQYAWFKAGAAKAIFKQLFIALYEEKLIRATVFNTWLNDTSDKDGKKSKPKAVLQTTAWIPEIQPKQREVEEESDADDELAEEFGDNDN